MQLGMIGLGRMGANLVRRSMPAGHECVVYDHDPASVEALVAARRGRRDLGGRHGGQAHSTARDLADGAGRGDRPRRRRHRNASLGR